MTNSPFTAASETDFVEADIIDHMARVLVECGSGVTESDLYLLGFSRADIDKYGAAAIALAAKRAVSVRT